MEKGDFIEYEFYHDHGDFIDEGFERYELTRSEIITVEGKSYNCYVISCKRTGDSNSNNPDSATNYETVRHGIRKIYIDKITNDIIKETDKKEYEREYEGELTITVSEWETVLLSKKSNWESNEDPGVGDSWLVTTEHKTTVKSTEEGEEEETFDHTEQIIIEYKYLYDRTLTTDLGTFECMVIKSKVLDTYDNGYSLDYVDKSNNVLIRCDFYEDDYGSSSSVSCRSELVAYDLVDQKGGKSVIGSIIGEDDKNMGIFGLGTIGGVDTFIFMIIAIAVIIILFLMVMNRKRKMAKVAQVFSTGQVPLRPSYQQRPIHQQPTQQQYLKHGPEPAPTQGATATSVPQSVASPQPPSMPHETSQYQSCPVCYEPIRYVDQYQRWYCSCCGKYL
jgi:hypothetical protein